MGNERFRSLVEKLERAKIEHRELLERLTQGRVLRMRSGSGAPNPTQRRFERGGGLPTSVLDAREAAAYLGVTNVSIYRLVRSGQLAHVRIGRSVRFLVEDLDHYLSANRSRVWSANGTRSTRRTPRRGSAAPTPETSGDDQPATPDAPIRGKPPRN